MTVEPEENESLSSARQRPYASSSTKISIIFAVVAGLAAVAGVAYWFAGTAIVKEEPHRTAFRNDNGEAYQAPIEKVVARPPPPSGTVTNAGHTAVTGSPPPAGIPDPQLAAKITAQNEDNGIKGFLQAKAEAIGKTTGADGDEQAGEENALSKSLVSSKLPPKTKAYADKNYFYKIYPGTTIPLVRRTAINSQLPGFVMATIRDDVPNVDGFTLIPAGSHVFGQIKDSVRFGNDRIPILWTQIQTNDRPVIIIPISNPGADQLGRPGATGEVNNHVWEMLLATLTYTLIEAGPNVAIAALQNQNQNRNSSEFQFNQFATPGQTLGSRVLERYMNIPPTLEAPPGVSEVMVVGTEIDASAAVEARFSNPYRRVQQ